MTVRYPAGYGGRMFPKTLWALRKLVELTLCARRRVRGRADVTSFTRIRCALCVLRLSMSVGLPRSVFFRDDGRMRGVGEFLTRPEVYLDRVTCVTNLVAGNRGSRMENSERRAAAVSVKRRRLREAVQLCK